jgi:hypothetical protein
MCPCIEKDEKPRKIGRGMIGSSERGTDGVHTQVPKYATTRAESCHVIHAVAVLRRPSQDPRAISERHSRAERLRMAPPVALGFLLNRPLRHRCSWRARCTNRMRIASLRSVASRTDSCEASDRVPRELRSVAFGGFMDKLGYPRLGGAALAFGKLAWPVRR